MKTLFLFTKTFPYGSEEQYIESELQYLSIKFNKIIIYPTDYYNQADNHTKILPGNVQILNLNSLLPKTSANSLKDYLLLLKVTLAEFFETDDKKFFFKDFKYNIINFWTQLQLSKLFGNYLEKEKVQASECVFYSYWFSKSALMLSILKRKKKIQKFISRAHSVDLYHHHWGIINQYVRVPSYKMFKLKYADKIISVSQHGCDFLSSFYPEYSTKYSVSRLGVDEIKSNKEAGKSFLIVTCASFDFNKRIHLLAEALIDIKHEVEWFHFGTGNFQKIAEESIKKCGKNIKAHFKGYTPNSEVRSFLANKDVDLFINLSVVEGLPVSIMEAMSSKIAILATAIYGSPEAVINNKNGFLIDVNFTIKELTGKLNYCIEHKNELKEMGNESYNLYLEKFSAKTNYTNFATYLQSV